MKNKRISDLNEKIKKKYKDKTPGISVMAIDKGSIVYNEQFGLANLEYDIPMTEDTVFNLASVSKQMTAVAIMQLIEIGLLEYDKSIVEYLPKLQNYSKVTIRQLLNNCSGIEDYFVFTKRIGKSPLNMTNEDVYELLATQEGLIFEPESRFDYSNSNWVLLAILMETVTGMTFSKYMRDNIFSKLEMQNTIVFDEKQPIVKNRAYGYRLFEDKYYCNYTEAFTTGDGGIFSTLEDLYKWDQALYTDMLVKNDSLALAFTNGIKNAEEQYGFGWYIGEDDKGGLMIWHPGMEAGFKNLITRFIDREFTVIILSNLTQCTWDERKEITAKLYEIYNS